MWTRNALILLISLTTVLSYKYPYKYPCCKWKPIHGPAGFVPHAPKYIEENYHAQKIAPTYGVPIFQMKPVYGPPIMAKPVYGPPNYQKPPLVMYGPPNGYLQNFGDHNGNPQNFGDHNGILQTLGDNFHNHGNQFSNLNYHSGHSQNLIIPHGNYHGNKNLHIFAHHKVLTAAQEESKFPQELLNPFYKNPHLKMALAKHSWIAHGEKPVLMRETDQITRQKIYEVLSHAGFIKRR